MLETLKNAWKIADIRKKILYTLFILLLYRIGSIILPVAGVDAQAIANSIKDAGMLNFLNMLNGGALSRATIFAVGISPYITASIVMNLLTVSIPALERMAKEQGEEGREKIKNITRYVGIGMAALMGIGTCMLFPDDALYSKDFLTYATIVLSLTAGTAIVMWMADKITEKGIGNGISLIIFIGIVSQLPYSFADILTNISSGAQSAWILLPVVLFYVVLIAGVVFIDSGERRVSVQYAKRVVGRKQYGGQSSHIPMKMNSAGVMPIIFAMTILQVPQYIANFWPNSGFYLWYSGFINTWPYMILFGLLILAFSYFYNAIQFNAVDVSKNIQQYGGFIPGIRPGKPTSDYLQRISSRLTFFGGLFLAVLATIPNIITGFMGIQMAMSATGVLISVSVALETTKQLESQMLMRHYKGFLK